MHGGDNYADQSSVSSLFWLNGRSGELEATIDFMLDTWQGHDRIHPERIGAFGFSAGGFTVLTLVGAQPDLRRVAAHCVQSAEAVCELLKSAKSPLLNSDAPTVGEPFSRDTRIKSAVVAAPGLGFTMVPNSLANVRVPIQLWSAEKDLNVPYDTNTKFVREGLGPLVDFHAVAGASHFSFLTPCGFIAPPELCSDPGQFDRKGFHRSMNASVIRFFDKTIGQPRVPKVP